MTDIEWTDETWNPTDGCKVCSPGCANCYAMRFAGRFAKPGERYHGLVSIGKNKRAIWTGKGRLDAGKLAKPLHWKKPRRIFVNSMSDLFYEEFTNEEIAAVFGVMAAASRHTFQVLTKRANRMREWFEWAKEHGDGQDVMRFGPSALLTCAWEASAGDVWGDDDDGRQNPQLLDLPNAATYGTTWPLPNVWLGVSVENQDAADERIPPLLQTPAAVRFLSCEPLLGPIDLSRWLGYCERLDKHGILRNARGRHIKCGQHCGISWAITGCESGPGARPAEPDWYRFLRDQCKATGVPFFLKQAVEGVERCIEGCGERVRYEVTSPTNALASCGCTVEGAEMCSPTGIMFGPGSKRKAGGIIGLPYLDGVQHREFPDTRVVTP